MQDDAPADDQADDEAKAAADDTPVAADGSGEALEQDEAPDGEDGPPEEVDPSSLTVAALREHLQKRGLSTAGKKAELVERLTEAQVKG